MTAVEIQSKILAEIKKDEFDTYDNDWLYTYEVDLGEEEAEYPYVIITVKPRFEDTKYEERVLVNLGVTDLEVYNEDGALVQTVTSCDMEEFLTEKMQG